MGYFNRRVAAVTGGGSGVGRSLCRALAQRRATVYVLDINQESAAHTVREIEKSGGRASMRRLDVRDRNDFTQVLTSIRDREGRLDILFNCAAINIIGEAADMESGHWDEVLDVNLRGTVHGTTAACSLMIGQGFGHIVNISSVAGLLAYPTTIPYTTAKAAVTALSQSLGVEVRAYGVHVTVVCLGLVDTPIYRTQRVLGMSAETYADTLPPRRLGAERAAESILRAVARRRQMIVLPIEARLVLWAVRLLPGFAHWVRARAIRDFRRRKAS
jgi:NAD(P)-dependent dehydrogenase (short-subunit alcohol dehydrogenase family)